MSTTTQLHPPAPLFTESSLIDLSQKVYLITGATSGTGLALSKILYNLHATVYIGARSPSTYASTVSTLQAQCPTSKGELKPFIADLADLSALKPATEELLKTEWRLDVLFLNAGVMMPKEGENRTQSGHDLELEVNCLAHFLLASLLYPLMSTTASHFCHPNPSIRVIWVSALLNLHTPPGGVQFDELTGAPKQFKGMQNYMQSKAGVYLLAREFPKRQIKIPVHFDAATAHTLPGSNPSGVQHVAINPGFTRTKLQRHVGVASLASRGVMAAAFSKSPVFAAYTALYAAFANDVRSGDFVIPWGRKGSVPGHVAESTVADEGEKSVGERFYEWCYEQVKPFL